jgi:hypothetical protein
MKICLNIYDFRVMNKRWDVGPYLGRLSNKYIKEREREYLSLLLYRGRV